MKRLVFAVLLGVLGLLAPLADAQALGPSFVLGYNCQLYFIQPAFRSDGVTPATGPFTYSAYLTMSPSLPLTMPSTPTISNVAGATAVRDPPPGTRTLKNVPALNNN